MKFILYAFCANIANIVKNYLVENNAPFVYIILLSFVGSCFGFMFMNCILEWKIHDKKWLTALRVLIAVLSLVLMVLSLMEIRMPGSVVKVS